MEHNCTSLETSKRLKAAGFPQETEFFWCDVENPIHGNFWRLVYKDSATYEHITFVEEVAAPTAQELADELPSLAGRNDKFQLQITKATSEYQAWYSPIDKSTGLSHLYFETASTMSEALAALWLKLQETRQ